MSGTQAKNATAADFTAVTLASLPYGVALGRGPVAQALFAAAAAEFQTVNARVSDLTEVEADPTQTTELLSTWEAAFGLPDPCTPLAPTIAQRRGALGAKLIALGGQTPAYYVSVAAAMGYPITITQWRASRIGVNGIGDHLRSPAWDFTWTVNVAANLAQPAIMGSAAIGDSMEIYSDGSLACRLAMYAPAHTNLVFNYGG